MFCFAMGAPPAVWELEFCILLVANAAQLGRRKERVYLDERPSVPLAFVFQHAQEAAKTSIRNGTSQTAIL